MSVKILWLFSYFCLLVVLAAFFAFSSDPSTRWLQVVTLLFLFFSFALALIAKEKERKTNMATLQSIAKAMLSDSRNYLLTSWEEKIWVQIIESELVSIETRVAAYRKLLRGLGTMRVESTKLSPKTIARMTLLAIEKTKKGRLPARMGESNQ